MESISKIFIPENNKIELKIPDSFIGKRREVFTTKIEDYSVEVKKK